ncbi:MAG: class I SAM-dependent methyltransferase [Actinobacteria bacterium]|nr:class I SAM-dependent methyltransferase [Actinomycetota bacterium]
MLELACGTGRVAAALGAVGLDIDFAMARRAVARGVPVVMGDMRRFAFRWRFPLVLIPWNSLQLLDAAGRAACLACVAEHLAPDGLVGLELVDVEPLDAPMAPVHADDTASLAAALTWSGHALVYRRRYTVGATTVENVIELHPVADAELAAAGFEIVDRENDGPRRRLALRPLDNLR